ncbi:hypothetical protein M885DRAFT_528375 [Pelagophyceae sp. CCMP2097]|nr:hypothetical protein M885DRAFT_528375 [Pelagophyceae sp. CCMP2097]
MGMFDFLKKPPAPEVVVWGKVSVAPRLDALVPAVGVTVIEFYSMNDMKLGLNPVRQAMISTTEWIITDAAGAPVLGVNAGPYENIDQATMQKSLKCTDAGGAPVGAWEHYAVGDRIVIYGYTPAFKDQKPSKGTKCDKPVYALARGHLLNTFDSDIFPTKFKLTDAKGANMFVAEPRTGKAATPKDRKHAYDRTIFDGAGNLVAQLQRIDGLKLRLTVADGADVGILMLWLMCGRANVN